MAGDVRQRKRLAFFSNERFDQDLADLLSSSALETLKLACKTLFASTFSTAGVATGFIFTGGSVTANPVNPTDGQVRLNSELFVALDADDGLLVKPNGTTITINIPAGGMDYQVYAFVIEIGAELQVRQFITSTPPYTEVSQATDTMLFGQVGLYVRQGSLGSVLAEDAINGATIPLVFLGIASNTTGTVTFDKTGQLNHLTSAIAPQTPPANGSSNGASKTFTDQLRALLYMLGRDRWKGSLNRPFNVLSAANNFGAYSEPPFGIDYGIRKVPGVVTIGNGSSIFGDYDLSNFMSPDLCLQAAFIGLPPYGGVVMIKENVQIVLAGDVSVHSTMDVVLQGDGGKYPQLVTGAYKITFDGSGSRLTFQNLRITASGVVVDTSGPTPGDNNYFSAVDCVFSSASISTAMITPGMNSTAFTKMNLTRCLFDAQAPADSATTVAFIDDNGIPCSEIQVTDCTFRLTVHTEIMVKLATVIRNVRFTNCNFLFDQDIIAGATGCGLYLNSAGGADISGRVVQGCSFAGTLTDAGITAMNGVQLNSAGDFTFTNCSFRRANFQAIFPVGKHIFTDCRFESTAFAVDGPAYDYTDATITGCIFNLTNVAITTRSASRVVYTACHFLRSLTSGILADINVVEFVNGVSFNDCTFYQNTNESSSGSLRIKTSSGSGSYITGLSIDDCTFTGGGNTTSDNIVLGLSVETYTLDMRLRGCRFNDMQNVAYSSAANTLSQGGFRVIGLRAFDTRGLLIKDNLFLDIATGITAAMGGVLAQGRMISLKPHIPGQTCGVLAGVQIEGNVFGEDTGIVTPFTIDELQHVLGDVSFSRNTCRYQIMTGVVFPYTADVAIRLRDAQQNTLRVVDNYFRPVNNTGADIDRDVISVGGTDGAKLANRVENVIFRGNIFDLYPSATHGYTVANGRGIHFNGVNFIALEFVGNTATVGDKFRTRLNPTTEVTGGSAPDASGYADNTSWFMNVGIKVKY